MQHFFLYIHIHNCAARKTFNRAHKILEDRMVQINRPSTVNALDLHFLMPLFAKILMEK